jgi:CRP-like cAMP-binding protein/small-conductance mechanosensitive channel
MLAGAGFLAYALAPDLANWLDLAPQSTGALMLHHLSGVWVWLALAWSCARLFEVLLQRAAVVSGRSTPYPRLLTDLLRAALFAAAAVAIVLFVFERPAQGLIATSSVVIAVVGFALRYIIGDIFSGLALSIEHPYRIGDWIETAQGSAGKVVEIGWRTTRLVDRNSVTMIIPNGLLAGYRLINYGNGEHDYRTALRVPLDPVLPAARVKRVLLAGALDAARTHPGLKPDVVLQDYIEGAAVYLVYFRVPDYGRENACRDAVASCVLQALHHAGLGIARAGRDVLVTRSGTTSEYSRRIALLRQIDLFRSFSEEEQAELAKHMEERAMVKGTVIVRQGDAGDSLYLLAEGVLDVGIDSGEAGGGTVVDRMVAGDVFGEMSLLTGQPRSATVTAAIDSVVYEIRKQRLDPILHQRPEIADELATVMARRQALNAERSRVLDAPQDPLPPNREDLLSRLRIFFSL